MVSKGRKFLKDAEIKRRKPKKHVRERILIACEGYKTEHQYFKIIKQQFRNSSLIIKVVSKRNKAAAIQVVDNAIKEQENVEKNRIKDPYDSIWCVIDVEAPHPQETLDQAYNKAQKHKIKIILSNPCFEYWYLLHFEKTSRLMQSCDETIRLLKNYHSSYYESDLSIIEKVLERKDTAIQNSIEVINEKQWGNDLRKCNPSTHVYKLVEHLFKMQS
ncbi:MAG: RloB domain-containing protein [candidate division Zixibacteria bacterium]|nr:RloB domain-containing protein [candidate division Zixibacteria bacterium]